MELQKVWRAARPASKTRDPEAEKERRGRESWMNDGFLTRDVSVQKTCRQHKQKLNPAQTQQGVAAQTGPERQREGRITQRRGTAAHGRSPTHTQEAKTWNKVTNSYVRPRNTDQECERDQLSETTKRWTLAASRSLRTYRTIRNSKRGQPKVQDGVWANKWENT